jgi:large subunit ribosomal protein L9
MEVILTQDIVKLGNRGDAVKVKDGYARNYLIPKKLALRETDANKRHFAEIMRQTRARMEKQRLSAEELRAKLDGEHIKFTLAFGETGKAYGSITAKQIAEGFRAKGIYFDHHQVVLDSPLKEAGAHDVQIRLFGEVVANVKVWVVPEEGEEGATEIEAKEGEEPVKPATQEEPQAEAAPEETKEE